MLSLLIAARSVVLPRIRQGSVWRVAAVSQPVSLAYQFLRRVSLMLLLWRVSLYQFVYMVLPSGLCLWRMSPSS